MKNKIKLLLTIFLPIILLVGGCSLFNKDDENNETQEEMFDKYLIAASNSVTTKDYTIVASLENSNDIKEISITKTKDKYFFKNVTTYSSTIEEKSILKQEENKYIEYSNINGRLSSSYITIDNFDITYSLTSNTYVALEILGYKTDALIKNYVERVLSNQLDVVENIK